MEHDMTTIKRKTSAQQALHDRSIALGLGMQALAVKLKAVGDQLMTHDDSGALNAAYTAFRAADEAAVVADLADGLTNRELRARKMECVIGHGVLMTGALADCAAARVKRLLPKTHAALQSISVSAEALLDAAMATTESAPSPRMNALPGRLPARCAGRAA